MKFKKLHNQQLSELPAELQEYSKLEKLDLSNNRLKDLPEWFGQFSKLSELNLAGNPMQQFPEIITACLALTKLILPENILETYPSSLLQLPKLSVLNSKKNRKGGVADQIMCVRRWVESNALTLKEGGQLLKLLSLSPSNFRDIRLKKKLLHFGVISGESFLEKKVLWYLHQQFLHKPALRLHRNSDIALPGRFSIAKGDYIEALYQQDILASEKLKKVSTHLVVTKNIGLSFKKIQQKNKDVIWITERDLVHWIHQLNGSVLLEESPKQRRSIQHIKALVLSDDPKKLDIGLRLLHNSPIPKSLLTTLYIVYHTVSISQQTSIKRLIWHYVPFCAQAFFFKKIAFSPETLHVLAEKQITEMIEDIVNQTKLDGMELARYVLSSTQTVDAQKQKAPKGVHYVLINGSATEQYALLEQLTEEGKLDLRNRNLVQLPMALFALKNIKYLYLDENPLSMGHMRSILSNFAALPQLEEIHIKETPLLVDPQFIMELAMQIPKVTVLF